MGREITSLQATGLLGEKHRAEASKPSIAFFSLVFLKTSIHTSRQSLLVTTFSDSAIFLLCFVYL